MALSFWDPFLEKLPLTVRTTFVTDLLLILTPCPSNDRRAWLLLSFSGYPEGDTSTLLVINIAL